VDITLSWKNIYANNRKVIDPLANRFFFVQDPWKLIIKGVKKPFIASIPLHPDYKEKGKRVLKVDLEKDKVRLLVSGKDSPLLKQNSIVRLIELFNIQIEGVKEKQITAYFHSEAYTVAKRLKTLMLHWLPCDAGVPCKVVMPDGSIRKGLVEKNLTDALLGQVVQFERFGFVRVDRVNNEIVAYYAHR
jgi:glutamyl-tRNA synthetase